MTTGKIIVIGAGIGGLAAGYWLAQEGFDVEVLEASGRSGGRMRTMTRKGDHIDVGAQFFHSNYHQTLRLLDALKMSHEKRRIGARVQFMRKDGSPSLYDYRIPYMNVLGLRGNLKLYWFVLRYILLGPRFPLYRITVDIPKYDDVKVLDLFRAPSDEAFRDFLITGVTLESPEDFSLYHFIHSFRIGAFSGFVTLRQGIASLAANLADRLLVRYETPVRRLVMEGGRAVGVQLEKDGSVTRADHVIVAVDPPSAAALMPEELQEQRRFFESIIHIPFPMPIFFLDRPLRKDVWAYFSYPGLRRPFLFAVDQLAKAPEMIPSGKSVLSAWLGYAATGDLIHRTDDEIIEIAREDIEIMVPGFSNWIEDAMVVRHPYHVAEYHTGAYGRVARFQREAERWKGLSFVSDLFGSSCIEGAVLSAAAAVNRVRGAAR